MFISPSTTFQCQLYDILLVKCLVSEVGVIGLLWTREFMDIQMDTFWQQSCLHLMAGFILSATCSMFCCLLWILLAENLFIFQRMVYMTKGDGVRLRWWRMVLLFASWFGFRLEVAHHWLIALSSVSGQKGLYCVKIYLSCHISQCGTQCMHTLWNLGSLSQIITSLQHHSEVTQGYLVIFSN